MLGSIKDRGKDAKQASIRMSSLDPDIKNKALSALAKELDSKREDIVKENEKDIKKIKKKKDSMLLKRLIIDDQKINDLIKGINQLTKIDDPINQTLKSMQLDKGMDLYCVSCPIGVIGVFLESKPEALVEIASLCLKSGNAVLLLGAEETPNTNDILFKIVKEVTEKNTVPQGWIQASEKKNDVKKLLSLNEYMDLVIPHGSANFVKSVMQATTIPVLGHLGGKCHIYVDDKVDMDLAISACYDSRCQNPPAFNSMETLLVHKDIASEFLPKLKDILDVAKVKLIGDDKTRKILSIEQASEKDWSHEYNDLILPIKIVEDMDEAIEHVNQYGSHHTDAIMTKNRGKARRFMQHVDSANVFCNCSTRFSDGYRYGLGAEICISTSKIHARGPVSLEGLVIYKWKLIGNGDILSDYMGSSPKKKFTHLALNKKFPLDE
jgi:glutamate-5-semialdehyde dehydrogenase